MNPPPAEIPDSLRWAVQSFNVDRVTAEVVAALADEGIECILLKGPAIATWLYSADRVRLYSDTDLLIRRRDWARAEAVMRSLGFADQLGPLAHPRMESGEGFPWGRNADGANVDLHCTLFGIGATPEALWTTLWPVTEAASVGGAEVRLPSRPARLLHIALHAVQHGGEARKTTIDLEQALEKASPDEWRQAKELADRLDATEPFAVGLRLGEGGDALVRELDADLPPSAAASMRLEGVPLAEGFAQLSETPGLRAKLALLARETFPSRTFMRWWSPIARRGPIGLTLAYFWRPAWLLYRTIPGYRAWRRAASKSSEATS